MAPLSREADRTSIPSEAHETEVLSRITALHQAALPLDELLHRILTGVTEELGVERAELYMLDERDRVLIGEQAASRHQNGEEAGRGATEGLRIPLTDGREVLSAAALLGRTHVIDDLEDPREELTLPRSIQERLGSGAFAAVPLVTRGQVVGVITLSDGRPDRPSLRRRIPLLNAFATQAGLAIERARLHEDRERAIRDLSRLQTVTAALQASRSLPEILTTVRDGVAGGLGVDRAALYLYDADRRVLRDTGDDTAVPVESADEVLPATVLLRRPFATDGLLTAPLLAQDRVVGVLAVRNGRGGVPARDRLQLLAAYGAQAGIAIERTLLEEELRASEKRAREFIELSPDGIAETALDGRILSCNERLARMVGYTREELIGMRSQDLYIDPARRGAIVSSCLKDGRVEGAEIAIRSKTGDVVYVSVSSRLRRDGGEAVLESIVRDVTGRFETERRLRALNEVVSSSADAIIGIDPGCRISSWNVGAEAIFGYGSDEITGRPYTVLVPADLMEEFEQIIKVRVEQDGRLKGFETERMHKDGRRVPVSVTVTKLRHNGGPDLGWSIILRDLTEHRSLAAMSERLEEELSSRSRLEGIVGDSRAMEEVRDRIRRVARFSSSVMLVGPSGTGKEVVANAIHYNSPRRKKPLVKVNCAAIPEDLLESELFGIERNVATGVDGRIGRFEMADGGTLFLDEIGDMSLATQAKILRALQEREFERVGGKKVIRVDVRIIAATNKDLEAEIRARRFRDDLFYRLNVIVITLPALAVRREDIDPLIDHFLARVARENNLPRKKLSLGARLLLNQYEWPGNVRELEHCIERAVVMSEAGEISEADLPPHILIWKEMGGGGNSSSATETGRGALGQTLREAERRTLLDALERSGWVQARAARVLGISERSMWYRVKKLGLTRPPN